MNRLWMRKGIVVFAAAVALISARSWAAKPPGGGGGGPPPAAGKIYFNYGSQPYSMNGSGGSKTPLTAAAAPGTVPSRLRYSGGRRWSLFVAQTGTYDRYIRPDGSVGATNVPHYDLFASRPSGSGTEVHQITDLYGAVLIRDPLESKDGFVAWSNDGEDSFVSCSCIHLADNFRIADDGATEVVFDGVEAAIVALPVSGAELDSAAATGTWTPIDPQDDWEIVVSSPSLYENNFNHSWSPDGSMVAYVLASPDGYAGEDVYVTDLATGATQRLFDAGGIAPWVNSLRWQPDGEHIVFCYQGDVWLADTFGAATRIATASSNARWSPDGNHLIVQTSARKGSRYEYQLLRYDMATGASFNLTADLDKNVVKELNDWLID